MTSRIDHVIYLADDLDVAQRHVEESLGLPVQPGGRHTGQGTHNRIVPLGGGYLELMAIADAEEAAGHPFGSLALERLQRGDGLWAWAAVVEDVEAHAQRLGTPLHRVERDGFGASVTGIVEALSDPYLPFFLARDAGTPDPSGGGDAGGISWLELGGADEGRLRQWLGGAELPLRLVAGPAGVRAVGIGADRVFS